MKTPRSNHVPEMQGALETASVEGAYGRTGNPLTITASVTSAARSVVAATEAAAAAAATRAVGRLVNTDGAAVESVAM